MQAIYLPANNFKKIPTNEQLSIYALSYLSQLIGIKDFSQIPHNIRIKNLFDNHVWIYNKIDDKSFWVDFGTEQISIADNNGELGVICGSDDKFYAHIDINGKLYINGLMEEVESLWAAISDLQHRNNDENKRLTERLNEIELRLRLGSHN